MIARASRRYIFGTMSLVFAWGASSGCGAFDLGTSERVNDRVNPEIPLWYERPSGAMEVSFRRELTIKGRTTGEEWEHGRGEIDPANARIFMGSADHGLYALRATDGSTIWRYETLGAVQSEPYYDAELDIVYFGAHDGALYAVRAFDGSLVFRFDTGAEVTRKPVRNGETIFVANAGDFLYALDRRTGKRKWSIHRNSALGMEVSGYSGPAYDNGLVYMGFSDGHVSAYDAKDGTEKWSPVDLLADVDQSAGGEATKYLDVDTTPIVDRTGGSGGNGAVYVAAYATGVYALDARSGSRLWWNDKVTGVTDIMMFTEPAHPSTVPGEPPLPSRKILLASSGATGLWALDLHNQGKVLWRNKIPEGGITSPVACGGAVAIGTSRYGLFLVSPRNGKVIDGLDLGTGFTQTPAVFGGRLFALTNAGTLLGLRIQHPNPPKQPEAYPPFGIAAVH